MFGTGSLGAHTVLNLARRFESSIEFVLVDYDRIENVNIANQPWYDVNVGQLKVSVLSAYIYRVCKTKSITHPSKLETATAFIQKENKNIRNVDLFIDCFDNLPSRKVTQEIAVLLKKPILHSGFADTVMLCKWGEQFPLKNKSAATTPICNRRDLGPLVTLGAGITALVVGSYITDKVKNWALLDVNKGVASLVMG